jgi:hypothetical protein
MSGLEKLMTALDPFFKELDEFLCGPERRAQAVKRHRIETKDGHIVITGEFKSLTVNGKRVRL